MTAQAATPTTSRNGDMNSAETLIADYRDRLSRATADLPPGRRAELLDDIDAHLREVTANARDRASVLQVLDELGTPEKIADAARAESGTRPGRGGDRDLAYAYDVFSVLALLLGGFVVPLVGWLAGVVMIWNGPRWTVVDRWIGTLAWPAAIAPPVALFGAILLVPQLAPVPVWVLLLVGLLAIALLVVSMVHLLRVATRRRP
jgi:hypothetical protein